MAAAGLFLFFLCIGIAFYLRPGTARTLPLSRRWVLGLFCLKLCFALGYGYYIAHFVPGKGDTWGYFEASRQIPGFIHSIPGFFYWTLPSITHWTDLLRYAFWNDLKENSFQDLLAVMNWGTVHNFYTDTLLLCMLTYGGWLQFIRLLRALFPGYPPWTYILPFLFPSFLFFYSGLHPDSILFALLGYISFDLYRTTRGGGGRAARIRLIACFCLLAIFKAFLLLLLLPLLAGGWIRYRGSLRPGRSLTAWSVILAGTFLIFAASCGEMAGRQQLFLSMASHTNITETPLQPTLSSFVIHLPDAIRNGFFLPALRTSVPLAYMIPGIELVLLWALLVCGYIRGYVKKIRLTRTFFEAGCIYFAAVNWLLIGYSITVLGAIVRYRGLFLPFLLALFLFPAILPRQAPTRGAEKSL